MDAVIVAVGSELTNGSKLDTNSQWLSTELLAAGVTVRSHVTVADDLGDFVAALLAAAKADLIVLTGGLGPTLDDLTREALAAAFGRDLVLHEPSLEHIRELFASRGRVMPERNVVQAMLPAGGEPIPNPRGTAPGVWMETPRAGGGVCRVAALPGVPSEMRPMFRDSVLPRVAGGGRVLKRYRVNCFGAGESAVEERLGDLTARGREPEVGITAHEATITLRITASGATAAECDAQAAAVKKVIAERLGDLVFGEEDDELQDVVIRRLRARGETLAVIETSLTGGRLVERLSAVPAAAGVFRVGQIVMDLDPGGAVSKSVAPSAMPDEASMARGLAEWVRRESSASWGLSVVGDAFTGETPGTGTIAVVGGDYVGAVPYKSFGDPAIDRSRAAKTALDLLRRALGRKG